MFKIDLFKMEKVFNGFKSKPVRVNVIGTLIIAFGEYDQRDDWFRIDKHTLMNIYEDYDIMNCEDKILFETASDIFRTDLEVIFNCTQ